MYSIKVKKLLIKSILHGDYRIMICFMPKSAKNKKSNKTNKEII